VSILSDENEYGINTLCVHAGEVPEALGSIVTPIYQNATFLYPYALDAEGKYTDERPSYFYTRLGNPTVRAVERKLSVLEGADDAVGFSSGMAAITTTILSLIGEKGHIISVRDLYGGTYSFFTQMVPRLGHSVSYFSRNDIFNLDEQLRENTRILYVETPTNPTLDIYDLREIFKFAHEHSLIAIMDNTFPSPVNLQPLALGADVVIHSATKYLSGHSDIVAGIAAGSSALMEKVREAMTVYGGCMDPHTAFLLERGMKTLYLRVKKQNENAMAIAEYLQGHRKVSRVLYPGLSEHPGHDIARSMMKGFGGMLSFELRGMKAQAQRFIKSLKLAKVAASLGGVESLVTIPADTSHRQLNAEELRERGIGETLIRFSVGIEDEEDLIEDIAKALEV